MTPFRTPRLPRWFRPAAALALLALAALSAAGAVRPAAGRPVVVATRDLAAGVTLGASDVRLASWPSGVGPPGTPHLDAVIGHRCVGPITKGDAVTGDRLLGDDLLRSLRPGEEAVGITVAGPDGGSSLVHAGSSVDVLTAADPDSDPTTGTDPSLLAQSVRVIAVVPDTESATSPNTVPTTLLIIAAQRSVAHVLAEHTSRELGVVLHPPT